MSESRVLARLHRETRLCHPDADADRMAVMTPAITPVAYRAYLVRIYGFEAPVDDLLARSDVAAYLDMSTRTRRSLLEADLAALGLPDTRQLPRCEVTQPLASVAVAFGWVYVLERNSLVHGIVERYLHNRLPSPMLLAGSYLREAHELRWRELGRALERFAGHDEAAIDAIVYGARFAFRSQRSWYQATGRASASVAMAR
jgi:heme oxygenase